MKTVRLSAEQLRKLTLETIEEAKGRKRKPKKDEKNVDDVRPELPWEKRLRLESVYAAEAQQQKKDAPDAKTVEFTKDDGNVYYVQAIVSGGDGQEIQITYVSPSDSETMDVQEFISSLSKEEAAELEAQLVSDVDW